MATNNLQAERGIDFDRDKFVDTVHWIIAQCTDPSLLGKTKLHKALYYADMLNFIVTRRPLTGVDYLKAQFGPTARYLDWALKQLQSDGRIEVRRGEYFGLPKTDYISRRAPATNRISESERELLGEVISFVCAHTAREISELSHARPWQNAEMGERIPYSSAFLLMPSTAVPSARDIEWAEGLAAKVRRTGT